MKTILLFLLVIALCCTPLLYAQKLEPDFNSISLPMENWSLNIDLSGFEGQKSNFSPDGTQREMLVSHKKNMLNVSVFIEPEENKGGAVACREFYWKKIQASPNQKDDIQLYLHDSAAVVEYTIKKFKDQTVNFHNANAFLAYKGYWIDVHISKVQYQESDKALFDAIIKSLRFSQPKRYNIAELFLFASTYYYNKKYSSAITIYEQLLAPQKEKIGMDNALWHSVVDNLGMAYGVSGNTAKAKEVYSYALKLDAEYPMFYYNLACCYGEESDAENAVKNLEQAYKHKDKSLPGEEVPNPKEDPSFQKMLSNPLFTAFLKKYKLE